MAVRYDQFILFGDSITQFAFDQERGFAFGAQLAHDYMRKLDVIDRGFSGYNTSQALRVMSQSIPSPDVAKVRFVTIFLGANDATLPTSPSKQHIPLSQYTSNLHSLLNHPSLTAHSPHLILITPPPLNEHSLDATGRLQRTAPHTKLYRDATLSVAQSTSTPVIDLWGTIMAGAGWTEGDEGALPGSVDAPRSKVLDSMMYDGLHLDAEGYKVLHGEVRKLIAREWPEETPEELPDLLPKWDDGEVWRGKLAWE